MSRLIRFLVAVFSSTLAFAHHSGAQYDMTQTATMQATVTSFIWTNPHVVLMVMSRPKDGHPAQEWRLELTGPGRLTRSGFTKRLFQPGDEITVDYSPMRDGSHVGWLKKAKIPDGTVLDFMTAQTAPEGPNAP